MQNETCNKFKKQSTIPHGQPGSKFVKERRCWSYVSGTEEWSTHDQSRADRDQYLTILEDNMKPGLLYNYDKLNVSNALTYNTKYNYGSDMQ
uniref:Astacin domain-containing protein n=1 Tax=Strongyloides venezuelensis TaxID=75913 RepID=A0A0K0FJA2_STRVS